VQLNTEAREQLRNAGISVAQWARENYFADSRWHGDACGCPDDRCIGFHHDEDGECGCLPALLSSRATLRKDL
jgi:hypothetical protein